MNILNFVNEQLLKSFKKSHGGIYFIYCIGNDKIYIGSATIISSRFCRHKRELKGNYHDNDYLQNAWNKYGPSMFIFGIIENIDKKEQLRDREHTG